MDYGQREGGNLQKRNELLLKIFEGEYEVDRNQVTLFFNDLIEAFPFEYYDKRALNSLKHGMNMKKILPCKLKGCIYSEYCPVYQSQDASHIEVGSPCRLEIELYLEIVKGLDREYADKESKPPITILVDYIIASIKNDRNRRLISLEGGFIERPGISRLNNKGLSLGFRYWTTTRNTINTVIGKLINE